VDGYHVLCWKGRRVSFRWFREGEGGIPRALPMLRAERARVVNCIFAVGRSFSLKNVFVVEINASSASVVLADN
jgi:hypothetical protein